MPTIFMPVKANVTGEGRNGKIQNQERAAQGRGS